MKISNLLLCCYLMTACSSSGDPKFPREETIVQELFLLQGVTDPLVVELKHPFLIVQNLTRTDSLFHIYDINSCELKSVFGEIGRGPNELSLPELYNTSFSDVLIGDVDKKIYRYSINEDGLAIFKDVRQVNGCVDYIYDASFINDSLFVIDAKDLAPSLYLFSIQDELPRKIKQFRISEEFDYELDPEAGYVYASENRIALCYKWKKQIDFMDLDLNLLRQVVFNFDISKDINYENEEMANASYIHGYFGKRYFYALFLGKSKKEHLEMSNKGAYLEVFDFDGNPIARYYLDGVCPVYFAIDEETFTLYGSGGNELEDYLVMYKLKGLK